MTKLVKVNFDLCDPAPSGGYLIYYRIAGTSDALTFAGTFFSSPASFVVETEVSDEEYEGTIQADCGEEIGGGGIVVWATGDCVDATATDIELPDGSPDNPYGFAFIQAGTPIFTIVVVDKPAWMTITAVGFFIAFGGTPAIGDVGTAITVSFEVHNCASGVAEYSTFVNIVAP